MLAILAAMLIPALAGDPVVAADTPRKEPSLPAIYSHRAADVESLRRGFTVPREAGPWVYWMFFENVMAKEEITRELEEMAVAGIAGAELRFVSMHGFSGKPGPCFDPEGRAVLGQKRLEFPLPRLHRRPGTHPAPRPSVWASAWRSTRGWAGRPAAPGSRPNTAPSTSPGRLGNSPDRRSSKRKSLGPGSMILAWRIDTAGDEKAADAGIVSAVDRADPVAERSRLTSLGRS